MFVGKDVAQALGYSNTRDALNKHVDAEDRLESQIATSGQRRSFIIINESGLYSLILSSKLPQAKAFQRVLTDGPISRINFCTIPEQEIGGEQPVYGVYDAAFDEALKPYIDNLVAARGLISCPQATKLAKKLQAECAEFARLSQSDVYWNLSHRADDQKLGKQELCDFFGGSFKP